MAMIECPECEREVSDQATSCPHCGFPLSDDAAKAAEAIKGLAMIHDAAMEAASEEEEEEKKEGCFVATAIYGSYDCPQVVVLRHFRDRIVAKVPGGTALINLYYRHGPTLAERLTFHKNITKVFRWGLDVFVAALRGLGIREQDE